MTFVNAHTHLYSGLAPFLRFPPATEGRSFRRILEEVWWRLDRALDEETLRASARWYAANAAALGTDTLFDHHESPSFIEGSLDVIADACTEFGVRAVVCYGATERNGGSAEAKRGLAECRRFLEENDREGVRGAVGLHASFTVSNTIIREAANLAEEYGTVLHLHLAEAWEDVEDAHERGYEGPLERLAELGALTAGTILAHGVHLSREQVERAHEAGCWFVHNPRSNRANGVGYANDLSASSRVALGTDGFPSAMDDERDFALNEAREADDDREKVLARLEAGRDLAAEFFEDDERPAPRAIYSEDLAELEAEARRAAAILQERLDRL